VSLRQAAGVEAHFSEFVRHAQVADPSFAHGWLDAAGAMHPYIAERLEGELAHVIHAKRAFGIRLPTRPAALRTWHCRRSLAAAGTDVLVIWNRTTKVKFALDAAGDDRCIHWEHGAAWDGGREAERRDYFRRVRLAIANSTAAARVLKLQWQYAGDVRVCRNALRPSVAPAAPVAKRFPHGRPIKLGTAARLYPVKGLALVLHAVAALRRSLDVELEVAGAGPELERLTRLADRLGLRSKVKFHGAVNDMPAFYASIDCLVHTPITEAFGLVAVEAAAHGCYVVAANVDGLAEAVADGTSGRLIAPTLPLARYVELGGSFEGMPQCIYDPSADALAEPRAVDPERLAAEVAAVFDDARAYEARSAAASAHVLARPSFAEHVRGVMAVIDEFVRGHGRAGRRSGA
jgi:glycosyltransferase involved in cell wall biosynthesis